MRKILLTVVIGLPLFSLAQIGIKAGINFANVTNASDISASNNTGFHAGIFLAPPSKGVISFRTELLFSGRVITMQPIQIPATWILIILYCPS